MNDNDLERELRSQRGPREEGYTRATLPMTPDDLAASHPRPARLPRVLMFAGAAAAGALAIAILAGVLSGGGPDVGSSGSTSPSASAPEPRNTCGPMDVAFAAEPWGGAAGSRGTIVTVSLAAGRYDCTLPTVMTAQVADADGHVLVQGTSTSPDASVPLVADAAFVVRITWSNWCGSEPARPFALALQPEGWGSAMPIDVPPGTDSAPPCNGGASSTLSVSAVEPSRY